MKIGLGGGGSLLLLVAIFWAGAGQRKEHERSMQAERSLRESEMRAGNVMESALDVVVMMDREGRLSGSPADATGIDRTLRERS
jgi:PAS domain-containing protein